MTACAESVSPEEYKLHLPTGEVGADEIMANIAGLNAAELASMAKFSGAMAVKALRMAYEFPNKSLGAKAIEAFTGVVFKAFDYSSLDEGEREIAGESVRLISSLYGWLRPDDIIKAYRLDFNTALAPGDKPLPADGFYPLDSDTPFLATGHSALDSDTHFSATGHPALAFDKPMWSFWKRDVTISLVKEIKERNGEAVLNLLPGDAAKMIDWKLVKNFAKVWKVDFKELSDGGEWKTPTANRLKELRGHLLREIVTRKLDSPRDLLALDTDRLLALGTPDYPDHIAFCVK